MSLDGEIIDNVIDLHIGVGLGKGHRGESKTGDKVTEHDEVVAAYLPV